jgi:tetrahydromethanopterin S-methyltransferase subunit B
MVSDIQRWEKATDRLFNELDPSKGLTTLPSAYNVMAMAARPKNIG